VPEKEINHGKRSKDERRAEAEFLRDLPHHNIVKFYGYEFHDEKKVLYIYMEYCPSVDLRSYIEANGPCKEDFIWRILVQLVSALHLCHVGNHERADKAHDCPLRPQT
jgi:serine/threonine protein kinase